MVNKQQECDEKWNKLLIKIILFIPHPSLVVVQKMPGIGWVARFPWEVYQYLEPGLEYWYAVPLAPYNQGPIILKNIKN